MAKHLTGAPATGLSVDRRYGSTVSLAGGSAEDFISTARHQLQTPLTSIRAFAEILLDNPDMNAEQRQRFLRIVASEAERLSERVREILDYPNTQ